MSEIRSLADVLPRVSKPDRRERHEVKQDAAGYYLCSADDCWWQADSTDDDSTAQIARHVVENQWQSK